MQSGWQDNFSYDYFKEILKTVKSNFDLYKFSDAEQALKTSSSKHKLFLRHDIDVNIDRAIEMAKIEKMFDIKSTYFVMTRSPFYSLKNKAEQDKLRKIGEMDHEIGLHYDFTNDEERDKIVDINDIEEDLIANCHIVEDITSKPVMSVSFHRPKKEFLRSQFMVAGKISSYSAELMERYLSDSKGNWREGEPLPKLLNPGTNSLQLLIHPIWWGNKHMSPEDRIQEFFDEVTTELSATEKKSFDMQLIKNLEVVRSNLKDVMKNG